LLLRKLQAQFLTLGNTFYVLQKAFSETIDKYSS
jgi:hypothetical protein